MREPFPLSFENIPVSRRIRENEPEGQLVFQTRAPLSDRPTLDFPLFLYFAVALGCGVVNAGAQSAFVDFNIPGQYASNFNSWNDVGGTDGGNYCFAEG